MQPLDEVRSGTAVFDETLFRLAPSCTGRSTVRCRASDSGSVAPQAPAFLRFGSWIGADRDGNPFVTAHHPADRADPGRARAARPGERRHPDWPLADPRRGLPPLACGARRWPWPPPGGAIRELMAELAARSPGAVPRVPAVRRAAAAGHPAGARPALAGGAATASRRRRGPGLRRPGEFIADLRRSSARWPRPGRQAGLRRAAAPDLAGRRRSASTWPAWRSVSTAPSMPRRCASCAPGRAAVRPDPRGARHAAWPSPRIQSATAPRPATATWSASPVGGRHRRRLRAGAAGVPRRHRPRWT